MRGDKDHLTRDQMDLFLGRKLSKEQSTGLVRHLLTGCPRCAELAGRASGLIPCPEEELDYESVFRRLDLFEEIVRHDIAREREHAAALWPKLQALPPEQRLLAVRNDPGYQFWGLYDRTLHASKAVSRLDLALASDLAYLALAMAERLDPRTYGETRVHDFRAAAYGALANVNRLAGDFADCEEALRAGWQELEKGTEDPLEEVSLLSLYASFLNDLGELEGAVAVLDRARRCCRRVGDRHLEGRMVLHQASTIGETDPHRGIELARRALTLIDAETDPHLDLGVRHILAFCLNAVGDTAAAEALLDAHRHLYFRFPDPVTVGRLQRLEASIAREKGDLGRAELLFRDLHQLYKAHNLHLNLVLNALELTEVVILQGRVQESIRILAETYPVLEAWDVHVDVLRSWQMVQREIEAREAGARTLREMAELLRRRWRRR